MIEPANFPMSHWHSALPLDTIGTIINFLIEDNVKDLQSLKACSLVCQSFLFLCRPHMFSSITIQIKPDEQLHDTEALGQLLLKTPEIARFIRHLKIELNPSSVHDSKLPGNLFDQVPQQLTRLQSLTFWRPHDYNHDSREVDWSSMTSSIQRSLLNLMHLPTITHLKLGWIKNFPISNLIPCTHLKHLSAEALNIILGEHDNSSSTSHGHMKLQELDTEIFGMVSTHELLTSRRSDGQSVLDLSGLEKLSVTFFIPWFAVQIRESFRMTHRLSEVHLETFAETFRALKFAQAVTPSLQKLKRVHLTFVVDNPEEIFDVLAGLCAELKKISGKNKLESIEIVINYKVVEDFYETGDEDCETGEIWGKLETVLLHRGWPTLKHVSLSIIIYRENDSPLKAALERLPETQFARLMSSKNLDFQFSICEKMPLGHPGLIL